MTNAAISFKNHLHVYHIRRPLPSLGLGGAAPGITAGVRHCVGPWHLLCFSSAFQAGRFHQGLPWPNLRSLKKFKTGRPLSAPPKAYNWSVYTVSKLLRGTLENL